MRSKQMWVRCGLLAVVVMSTCVSAAPSPGQLWPGLASGLASLEVTRVYDKVEMPELDRVSVDWYDNLWLWLSCPTPGAELWYTVDGERWWLIHSGVLIVTEPVTLYVVAIKDGMCPSDILVIRVH